MPLVGPDHWWSNWPATFGYVCGQIFYPRSIPEISAAIRAVPPGGDHFIKAVGGGWSFTDAALPGGVQGVSILQSGRGGTQNLSGILQSLPNPTTTPMDLVPEVVNQELALLTHYDYTTTTQVVAAGSNNPLLGPRKASLIDIRGLASSLQGALPSILSSNANPQPGTRYFHVEAGIAMADLQQLLDHQKPRLAIQATGGNPLATLAGSLSTATHGGEFQWPLLLDRVRAVHLVGPGGEEWWVEGTAPIADQTSLQKVYPNLDTAHFIGGSWSGIPGLTAEDVLKAVVVSMGTMGVIYSVVLEVVEQYGIRQVVTATNWDRILVAASTSEGALAANDISANRGVLQVLLDGTLNGTGIPLAENVYADLAINPFTRECWITNRKVTPLPIDANNPSTSPSDYISALSNALSRNAKDTVNGNVVLGRIFDFFNYATGAANWPSDLSEAITLFKFITGFPDLITLTLATLSAQAVANIKTQPATLDRGFEFLGDFLTSFLNALQGTLVENQFGNLISSGCLFWTGDFNGGGSNQILFYHPSDNAWWLGTFNSGAITWGPASNTKGFGNLISSGCLFWTGDFNGGGSDQILFYHPSDGNWFLGTFNGGSINWGFSSDTTGFGNLISSGCLFWTGDFNGGGSNQILFYHPSNNAWWLGTFNSGAITWGLASNTKGFGNLISSGCLFLDGRLQRRRQRPNSLLSPFRWQLVSRHVQRRFDHLGTCLQYQGFRQSYIERLPILDGRLQRRRQQPNSLLSPLRQRLVARHV